MSENLGIGVMINMLGGNKDTVEALRSAYGKRIESVSVRDNMLAFRFTDGSGLEMLDDGQSCCEHRWMHTDDNLAAFSGATLVNAELREGPKTDDEYEEKESQFLLITTSAGQFTVVNYNEHNGYYGGFAIIARKAEATS